ncbi:hypothetical protein QQ045_010199 [Rhodiola kirilowii]
MGVMKVGGIALLATLLLSLRICWIMKVGGFAVLVTLLLLSRMSGVIKVCGFAVLVTLLLSSRICGVIKLASFVVLVTLLLSSRMCSAGINPGCRDCRVDICPQCNPRSSKTGIGQDTGEGNKVGLLALPELKLG